MKKENKTMENQSERTHRICVVTCGLTPQFVKHITTYVQTDYPFVSIVDGGEHLNDLYALIEEKDADIALVALDRFTHIEKEQQKLKNTSLSKLLIVTEFLDTFKSKMAIDEPFASLVYEYTPVRLIVERMLTFEFKKKSRLYTHIHPENDKKGQQKIALFFSAKGGVGKTTVAMNVAAQLALKSKKVLLVDFATFGAINVMLNVPRENRGLADAVSHLEQSTWEEDGLRSYVEEGIYSVHIQGKPVDVLSAASPMKMTGLNVEKTDELLKVIQQLDYDVIIIDSSSDLSEKNISLISAATDIVYVTTTDIGANAALISTIELVDTLNKPLQNRHLIVNQYNDSLGFPITELEQILSMSISVVIPDKYLQVQGYANRGIITSEKSSLKINRTYRQVANLIQPIFSNKELGIRRRLFRKRGEKK